jgi:hypothetical protein
MRLQKIAPEDFVFSNEVVTNTCWRNPDGTFNDSPSFSSIAFTNGNPNASTSNNLTVTNYYQGTSVNSGNLQFSVANVNGNNGLGAIQNIVTGCKNTPISWGGANQTDFTVVSIARGSYKSALLPGSFRLGTLTDDSNVNPPQILNCGRAYNVVTGKVGSNGEFSYGIGTGTAKGLFLPDVGLILLDNFPGTSDFTLRTEDPTPTLQVFIRARNNEYNYSMNPSFISGSTGDIVYKSFIENPQIYITTVGLYNDDNVLMAVAKLPRPFNKNFTTELSVKIGLNF